MLEINIPEGIVKGIVSGPRDKKQKNQKVKYQRILLKNESVLQESVYTDKQVFHKNLEESEISARITELLSTEFTNAELHTKDYMYSFRVTSKGKVLSNRKRTQEASLVTVEQNRKKNYLIEEGTPVPALIDLGIMMPDDE